MEKKEQQSRKKYTTAEALEKKVNAYFDECSENGDVFPDEAGMFEYLDIRPNTKAKYCKDEAYKEVFEIAARRRESWLTRRMVSEPRLATGCLAALKQPKNGGYIDRPQVKMEAKTLVIKTDGVGDGAFE